MQKDGSYVQIHPGEDKERRSQHQLIKMWNEEIQTDIKPIY